MENLVDISDLPIETIIDLYAHLLEQIDKIEEAKSAKE